MVVYLILALLMCCWLCTAQTSVHVPDIILKQSCDTLTFSFLLTMAAIDRKEANLKKLKETSAIQDKTEAAIVRIQRQTAEAEEIGAQTLNELRRQGRQMDEVNQDVEFVSAKLTTSKALQSKFDAWAGNWLGGKRRAALKKAAGELRDRNKEEHSKIKEVFQQEKYEIISRSWKPLGMVLCADPSVSCDDLFDPNVVAQDPNSHWIVDKSLASIDSDGWTHANDVKTLNRTGSGSSVPRWNSYVRRRKWRYVDRCGRSSANGVKGVIARSEERTVQQATHNKHADRMGYMPRHKPVVVMGASGFSSAGMMGRTSYDSDQVLDEDAAAGLARVEERSNQMDVDINSIARGIDNLAAIGASMKDEIVSQNQKLEKIENRMQKATEKQTVVNAYQRSLVKHA